MTPANYVTIGTTIILTFLILVQTRGASLGAGLGGGDSGLGRGGGDLGGRSGAGEGEDDYESADDVFHNRYPKSCISTGRFCWTGSMD